ncbi:MAG: serine/threonine-protein kinase [Polyangiaceae bacterium]
MPAPPTRSELLKGARLGSYEVGALIGHGGMASVFEGSHVALNKPVAIKVLHEHVAQSEAMRARFLREARLAATLEHPHVVNILDVGVQGDIAYIVMERLQGEDMAAYLRRAKKLSVEGALTVLLPVASALAFAHERGIVHRDLKPANVFLAKDRHGELLPKIVDFGLSKLFVSDDAPLTDTDMVIGTLEYMAPEQTFGSRRVGPAADQYSLAAIFYEAVTGHLPFERKDSRELLDAIRYAPVLLPSALEPTLPASLDDAIARALSREPEGRFADVRDFASALLPLADARTIRLWSKDFGEAPVSRRDAPADATEPDVDTWVGVPPLAPPLPCDPGMSTFHIKGIAYRGVVRLVEERVDRGLAGLDEELNDPAVSRFIRQPFLAASRYDVLPMLPVNVAVARLLGKSLEGLASEQGIAQARFDARYVYRRLFDEMTFETLPAYLGRYGAQYYEAGECSAEAVAPGHALLRRKRVPAYVLPWLQPIHCAYAEEVIRLKGARTVQSKARPPTDAPTHKGIRVVDLDVDLFWRAP